MHHLEEILIPLIVFTSLVLVVYFITTTRHRERMAMIEKGIDLSSGKSDRGLLLKISLKIGFLVAGAGFGVFLGSVITTIFHHNFRYYDEHYKMIINNSGEVMLALSFFLAGIGLVASHYFEKKWFDKE